VVVRAHGEAVVVELMDPKAVLGLVGEAGVDEIATEIRARLVRAVGLVETQFAVTETKA
jgi:hypothetical protein